MNEQFNYIPKKQFLEIMNITRWTFTNWVEKRDLPIIQIGYRTFIPFSEYQRWVKGYEKNITPLNQRKNDFEWDNIFSK